MGNNVAKQIILELLNIIDVKVNGNNPWDITIHNENFYSRVFYQGALGLGESYMDEWWDCKRIDMFIDRIERAQLDIKLQLPLSLKLKYFFYQFINLQTKRRSREVAEKHYDLGNLLFKVMLDKNMLYSCGYWKDAKNLEEAQLAKLDLICQKLHLRPGERLLDIGCGWGGLSAYAATHYGVSVVGVTISKRQQEYASELCKSLPVQILLCDYRDIQDSYDKIVSVGMFEHVGHLNYLAYMKKIESLLKAKGLFLLHTIGNNYTLYFVNEWTSKYIFPNGNLPSITQIANTLEKRFIMEDWQNLGSHYDPTLMSWYENFVQHWPELKSSYDEQFYRMWTYYLLSSAGSFRARTMQVWQIVLSKEGVEGGYVSSR